MKGLFVDTPAGLREPASNGDTPQGSKNGEPFHMQARRGKGRTWFPVSYSCRRAAPN